MRAIHLARMDKSRPVLVLTRTTARGMTNVTVATITSSVRGLASEVLVGRANGLDHDSAISCDNVYTIHRDRLGRQLGFLLSTQELELTAAIAAAFDLR